MRYMILLQHVYPWAVGVMPFLIMPGCGHEGAIQSAASPAVVISSGEEPRPFGQQSPAKELSPGEKTANSEDEFDLRKILATKDEFQQAAIVAHERAIIRLLVTTPSPEINISQSMPLSAVLTKLAEAMNQHSNIPVRFALDQTDPDIGEDPEYLENTSIGPLTISAGTMRVSSALAEVLSMVKDQELAWMIQNESIVITTIANAELPENLILRSYDIGPMLRTGVSAKSIRSTILSLSTSMAPWLEHGDDIGTLEVVGDHLIVQQIRRGHQTVFEIVERMKQGLESFDAHKSKTQPGPSVAEPADRR